VIDRFTIHYHMSDVVNEARLRRVIKRPPHAASVVIPQE